MSNPDPRLTVGTDGRVRGNANVSYNRPFPTHNGFYGSGTMNGLVMHTEVGFEKNVIVEFNTLTSEASAHFSIDIDGHIHQYGPIGKGWCSWAQADGNLTWYSAEHADQGKPNTPLTAAQIEASAQVLECLSNFASFPLQEANTTSERGFGVHYMGGVSWGGHTCPDLPPKHVRSHQRPAIITRAKAIRAWTPPAPAPTGTTIKLIVTNGKVSLKDVATNYKNRPFMILWRTFGHLLIQRPLLRYATTRLWTSPIPAGVQLAVEVPK